MFLDMSPISKGVLLQVTKSRKVVMQGEKVIGLHTLVGETITGMSDATVSKDITTLWHKRLACIGEKRPKRTIKEVFFLGIVYQNCSSVNNAFLVYQRSSHSKKAYIQQMRN